MNLNHIKCYAFMLFLIKKKGKAVSSNANLWNTDSPTHVYNSNIMKITIPFLKIPTIILIDQTDLMTLKCPAVNILDVLSDMQDILRTFRMSNSTVTINIVRILCKESGGSKTLTR